MRAATLLTALVLASGCERLAGQNTALTGSERLARQHAALSGSVHFTDMLPAGSVVALLRETEEPAAELGAGDTVLIDQFELRFQPAVLAMQPGTIVLFRNSDPVLHNVFSPAGPAAGFNLGTYPRPGTRARRFEAPGVHVILCHIHPEMAAYVTVVPTPYYAVADSEGRFAIAKIPPGRYLAQVWVRRRLRIAQPIQLLPGDQRVVELNADRREDPR